MKKIRILLAVSILCLLTSLVGCSDNVRARKYGGKETIQLKSNERLLNITWKDNDVWLLTEDTLTHALYFREKSSYGVWEGEINIK